MQRVALALGIVFGGAGLTILLWSLLATAPWEDSRAGTSSPDTPAAPVLQLRCEEALDLRQEALRQLPDERRGDSGPSALEIANALEAEGITVEQFLEVYPHPVLDWANDPTWQPSNDFERSLVRVAERLKRPTPVPSEAERLLEDAEREIELFC